VSTWKRCTTLTVQWIGNFTIKWKFHPWTHEIPPWGGIPPRLGTTELTLCELGYDVFILWNRPKTSSCQLPYQRHSSSADCARELFKGSNRSASLLVCTWKKNFWLGVTDFLWVWILKFENLLIHHLWRNSNARWECQ